MKIKVNDGNAAATQSGGLCREELTHQRLNLMKCLIRIDRHPKLNFFEKKHYSYIAEILFQNTDYFEDTDNLIDFWTCNIDF